MKIEIEVSDVAFRVLEALAEVQKRDVPYIVVENLMLMVNEKIDQSRSLIAYIEDESRKAPQKAKRKTIPRGLKNRVFEKSNGICAYCGTDLVKNGNWHVDHVVPICRGGKDEIENLVAACHRCNTKKGDKPANEIISEDSRK